MKEAWKCHHILNLKDRYSVTKYPPCFPPGRGELAQQFGRAHFDWMQVLSSWIPHSHVRVPMQFVLVVGWLLRHWRSRWYI